MSNGKDQSAKLWDLRSMYSSDHHSSLSHVPERFAWDYRWMNYPVRDTPGQPDLGLCLLLTLLCCAVMPGLGRAVQAPA